LELAGDLLVILDVLVHEFVELRGGLVHLGEAFDQPLDGRGRRVVADEFLEVLLFEAHAPIELETQEPILRALLFQFLAALLLLFLGLPGVLFLFGSEFRIDPLVRVHTACALPLFLRQLLPVRVQPVPLERVRRVLRVVQILQLETLGARNAADKDKDTKRGNDGCATHRG